MALTYTWDIPFSDFNESTKIEVFENINGHFREATEATHKIENGDAVITVQKSGIYTLKATKNYTHYSTNVYLSDQGQSEYFPSTIDRIRQIQTEGSSQTSGEYASKQFSVKNITTSFNAKNNAFNFIITHEDDTVTQIPMPGVTPIERFEQLFSASQEADAEIFKELAKKVALSDPATGVENKYNMINNPDGTVSFTPYTPQ